MTHLHPANWLTIRRVRFHGILLAVGIWTAFIANLATPELVARTGLIKGTDFLHFYTLGTLGREHRGDLLYDIPAQSALLQRLVPEARNYVYVPLYGPQVSLIFAPLARLPYLQALTAWWGLNAFLYAVCCYLLWRRCPNLAGYGWTVLILALAFPGISQLLVWGQTSGLALLFFTLAYLALSARHDFLAGLAIGCLIFKPQLGLVAAVVFLCVKNWKVVTGAILSAMLQLAIAWLHYGSVVMRTYLVALGRFHQVMPLLEPRPYQTHCLRSFWTMIVPLPPLALLLYLASAVVVLFLAFHCWRSQSDIRIRTAVLLLATVLVSPHLTVYDLVILAPAFLLLADWTVANLSQQHARQIQLLIYVCFLLFLFGPIVRYIHLQISVLAMAALLVIASRLPSTVSSSPVDVPLSA
jgi:hypothetical protein